MCFAISFLLLLESNVFTVCFIVFGEFFVTQNGGNVPAEPTSSGSLLAISVSGLNLDLCIKEALLQGTLTSVRFVSSLASQTNSKGDWLVPGDFGISRNRRVWEGHSWEEEGRRRYRDKKTVELIVSHTPNDPFMCPAMYFSAKWD